MDKISVIIPVYNVREYIERCIESILGQTYPFIEVLCVDDGSTDGSGDICDNLSMRDERIKVYHIKNSGVGNARNRGLSVMTGEWFAFVDADDWIEACYLETLYKNAIANNCSVSACSFQRNEQYVNGYDESQKEVHIFSSSDECVQAYICPGKSLYGMVWNKLYLTERFRHIRFDPKIKVNEDCLYTQEIMEQCDRACVTDAQLYHWYYRQDSACHSKRVECDFVPADVFYNLYSRNRARHNEEIERNLKINYIKYIVKIRLRAEWQEESDNMAEATARCMDWRRDVWKYLGKKECVKFFIAFYVITIVKRFGKKGKVEGYGKR